MKRQVVLTVAESKRLIARAVARMDAVRRALREGMVVIAQGTTNSYVVEEILGRKIDKRAYVTGRTTPKTPERAPGEEAKPIPDIVLRRGEIVKELNRITALDHMDRGDVYIKGCNALDYRNRVAGILIGAKDGGTIGNTIGRIVGKRIHLILPVGLEKLVYGDIAELSRRAASTDAEGPRLMPVTGTIVTEIEALKILAGVDATLLAAGGVAGAEGAVRLLIEGDEAQVGKATEVIEEIEGEPRFLL